MQATGMEATAAESMAVADTLLVRLQHRRWSPLLAIPQATAHQWTQATAPQWTHPTQAEQPASIAVLRDAFSPHSVSERPLRALLAHTSPTSLAVTSELCRPASRAVVDVYTKGQSEAGDYELSRVSLDLLRYLKERRVHVSLAPTVVTATPPETAAKQSSNQV